MSRGRKYAINKQDQRYTAIKYSATWLMKLHFMTVDVVHVYAKL